MPNFLCILATALFWASDVLSIIYYNQERKRYDSEHHGYEDWQTMYEDWLDMDVKFIEDDWDFRMDKYSLTNAAGFCNAVAWFVFTFPMFQLIWVLSHQGTSQLWIHVTAIVLLLGANFTEWISWLFWMGSQMASEWMMDDFNLENWLRPDLADQLLPDSAGGEDNLGWLVLEVNHIVMSGFIWFVDAFEWICLGGILVLVYASVRTWRSQDSTTFGGAWNALGLFIAFLCLLEFIAEILRFEQSKVFGVVAIIYAVLNRLMLLPIWLLVLSFQLPAAVQKQAYTAASTAVNTGELALTELNGAGTPSSSAPARTESGAMNDVSPLNSPRASSSAEEEAPTFSIED